MTPRRVLVPVAAFLLLSGCTSFSRSVDAADEPAPTAAPEAEEEAGCPTERAEPDPDRPVISLDFRLEDDLTTVTGTEIVSFTPDLPVRELVFRLVPNGPYSASAGKALVVGEVRGDDVADGRYEQAGAVEPGGLYVVELTDELAAGETTEVELDFVLSLGGRGFDRVGADDGVSWWASGAPLLAWEPGVGWAEDPFVDLSGETASSPVADTTVTVSAPEELTVLMTGMQAEPSAPQDGRRTWTSTEPLARDVAVAAGEFGTTEREMPGAVLVRVGTLAGSGVEPGVLLDATMQAIAELEKFLGPFPYDTLTVPLLPDYRGGIEYPSLILQATPSRQVLVHEVAHMWFYGMVGNSQFRDPWLDEAFASWAESVADRGADLVDEGAISLEGPVGGSMADYDSTESYVRLVYGKGGAALLAARRAAGAEAFDAAIRCYVDATAWSIATPEDVGRALADLPEAVAVLEQAQALDEPDLPE